MQVPAKWQLTEQSTIYQFIEQYSFGVLVSPSLNASHLPLLLDRENNCILGHIARNNKHWQELDGKPAVAIFSGPHDYISPNWYANGPAVPTWNYAAVHVHGTVKLVDGSQTYQMLNQLMAKYEPELLRSREVVTEDIQSKLMAGIVGFSLSIENIDAKAKLGQHRKVEDQQGVVAGLSQSKSPDAKALLALMEKLQLGVG